MYHHIDFGREAAGKPDFETEMLKNFWLELPDLVEFLNGEYDFELLEKMRFTFGKEFEQILLDAYFRNLIMSGIYPVNRFAKLGVQDKMKYRAVRLGDVEAVFDLKNKDVRNLGVAHVVNFANALIGSTYKAAPQKLDADANAIYNLMLSWLDQEKIAPEHVAQFVKHYASLVQARAEVNASIDTHFALEMPLQTLVNLTYMGLTCGRGDAKEVEDLILKCHLDEKQIGKVQGSLAIWALTASSPNNEKFLAKMLNDKTKFVNLTALLAIYDGKDNFSLQSQKLIMQTLQDPAIQNALKKYQKKVAKKSKQTNLQEFENVK